MAPHTQSTQTLTTKPVTTTRWSNAPQQPADDPHTTNRTPPPDPNSTQPQPDKIQSVDSGLVTSRIWKQSRVDGWIDRRVKEGWADIKVLTAEDLATWLGSALKLHACNFSALP